MRALRSPTKPKNGLITTKTSSSASQSESDLFSSSLSSHVSSADAEGQKHVTVKWLLSIWAPFLPRLSTAAAGRGQEELVDIRGYRTTICRRPTLLPRCLRTCNQLDMHTHRNRIFCLLSFVSYNFLSQHLVFASVSISAAFVGGHKAFSSFFHLLNWRF